MTAGARRWTRRVRDTPIGGGGWDTGTAVAQGAIQETAAVGVAGKIYVIGGFDDNEGIVARVQVYDTATSTWSDGPALPRAVHHANAVTDGTTIYVLGALTGNNFIAIGEGYKLAPATDTAWTPVACDDAGPRARRRGHRRDRRQDLSRRRLSQPDRERARRCL